MLTYWPSLVEPPFHEAPFHSLPSPTHTPLPWSTFPWSPLPFSAAAAAKPLQSCPTLCDPIDGSPPRSPVPGILQARTLEWAAISFSNAWKWKVKVKSLLHLSLCLNSVSENPSRHTWSSDPGLPPTLPSLSPSQRFITVSITTWHYIINNVSGRIFLVVYIW